MLACITCTATLLSLLLFLFLAVITSIYFVTLLLCSIVIPCKVSLRVCSTTSKLRRPHVSRSTMNVSVCHRWLHQGLLIRRCYFAHMLVMHHRSRLWGRLAQNPCVTHWLLHRLVISLRGWPHYRHRRMWWWWWHQWGIVWSLWWGWWLTVHHTHPTIHRWWMHRGHHPRWRLGHDSTRNCTVIWTPMTFCTRRSRCSIVCVDPCFSSCMFGAIIAAITVHWTSVYLRISWGWVFLSCLVSLRSFPRFRLVFSQSAWPFYQSFIGNIIWKICANKKRLLQYET